MFSYKAQVDDQMEDDTVSLPHQQSFSSLKTDSDYIYQVGIESILIFFKYTEQSDHTSFIIFLSGFVTPLIGTTFVAFCLFQNNSVYNSTQLDANTPINPLYAASLQSPDSITGYSIDSCQSLEIGPTNSGYQRTNI